MYRRFQDRAAFLFVYVRENDPSSLPLDSPPTRGQGKKRAGGRTGTPRSCIARLKLTMPAVVDSDYTVGAQYGATPDRLYVVDRQGRVAYRGGRGPMDLHPDRLEAWLAGNL